jgi:ubiquinone/menaquinone biosynthesis C-methylase UbiE/uncharacterized protein YbaR (Trm112 family)
MNIIKCPNCGEDNLSVEIFNDKGEALLNGRIVCADCGIWYKIEDQIVDLMPVNLREKSRYNEFSRKWKLECQYFNSGGNESVSSQKKQIDFFRNCSSDYDSKVLNRVYNRILDRLYLEPWINENKTSADVLVIAGGSGREAIPLAKAGCKVFCIDISEDMMKVALNKATVENLVDRIVFILADADNLPFKSGVFEAAVCWGALHHLPNPASVIKAAGDTLRVGGRWISCDPNDSPVRFVYEGVSRIWRLYPEEANEDPLMKQEEIKEWCKRANIVVNIIYSTYILPHILEFMNEKHVYEFVKLTDKLFGRIPLLKKMAGGLIAIGVKTSSFQVS